jgi:multiple antibiotic resistance protein
MGWESLTSDKKADHSNTGKNEDNSLSGLTSIRDKLFYPITFPVTIGAGTISVLFTLSAHTAHTNYLISTGAILSAIVVICIMIYISYLNAKNIIRFLGANGEIIINRISAFLIFCVGLQIAISGIMNLIKDNYPG